jgi:undecaprenyl diphosphate synthase
MPSQSEEFTHIPTHVAIIMDGNGRWAKSHGLPRLEGHRVGTETLRSIIRACDAFGVKYLTVYAFSTENWSRPTDEVNGLMVLLESVVVNELDALDKEGVQIRHIGRLEALPKGLAEKVRNAIRVTKDNPGLILNIAWNYGGRDELVYAVQKIVSEGVKPEDITEETINEHLFTCNCPDPDLIIRTSGEYRTSNFMIWQGAYSEWVFTPVLWPDFTKEDLRGAIIEYGSRERRFGKV